MKPSAHLAAAITAFITAAGLLVWVSTGGPMEKFDAPAVRASLDACLSDAQSSPDALPYNADCLQTVWDNSARGGYLRMFITTMEGFVQDHPAVEIPCHDQAHTAGIHAFAEDSDVTAWIGDGISSTSVCDNGFVHGVIGAMARSGAGDEGVRQVIDACSKTTEPARSSCVHGSGHAVWVVAQSITAAAELCTLWSIEDEVSVCMSGVLMAVLSPQHDPSESPLFPSYESAISGFPPLCAEGETTGKLPPSWLDECFHPFGELAVQEYSTNKNLYIERGPLATEPAASLTNGSSTACSAVDEKLSRSCRRAMYLAVSRRAKLNPEWNLRFWEKVCAGRGSDAELCMSVVLTEDLER